MSLGLVLSILWIGLVVGGLARLALPGPDPMPLWLTISIGLVGSIAGAAIGHSASGGSGYLTSFVAFAVSIALVGAYRRFVQHRPLFGPEARKFPERGLGVEQYRERLKRVGIDPDSLAPDPKAVQRAQTLAALEHLHRVGLLDDEELEKKKAALDEPAATSRGL